MSAREPGDRLPHINEERLIAAHRLVPRDHIAARFHAAIELVGAQLVTDAMAIVANDACQRAVPVPCDWGPAASGYVDDPRSVRTLRILLAALNRVTRAPESP